ncbi:MAG TPA: MurR/RpiR family transcriptional regulator [Actinocrinis sp.]
MSTASAISGPSPAEQVLALLDGRRLSPAQRRIGQFLLGHLGEVVFMSGTDLAERVGVSQPSVTRFATALGFAGYPALREALQSIVLESPEPRKSPDDLLQDEYEAAIEAERENLDALRRLTVAPAAASVRADSGVQGSRLADAGRRLASSAPLPVLGLRLSQPVAQYFAYSAARIHPDVRLISSGGSTATDILHQAAQAGSTALAAFLLPRYSAEAVSALECARGLGLHVVLVTDHPLVPFAAPGDLVLPARVGSRLVFDSHAAPMLLAALLVQAMADAEPERAQQRLEAYEALSETKGYYLT